MANVTSFQADILPLFTDRDIHAMSKAFNLGNYDDVKRTPPLFMTASAGSGEL